MPPPVRRGTLDPGAALRRAVTFGGQAMIGTLIGIGIGIPELLVILLIVVLIFGARRLPEIGSGMGKAIKNFRAGVSGKDEIDITPKKDEVSEGERS